MKVLAFHYHNLGTLRLGGPTSSYRPASTAVKFTDAHKPLPPNRHETYIQQGAERTIYTTRIQKYNF